MPTTSPSVTASAGRFGSRGGALSGADPGSAGWCGFEFAAGRFALDVRMVGEVVAIDRAIVVPRAPRGVLGLFNLRGVAVGIVERGVVLDAPAAATAPSGTGARLALVLRSGATVIAAVRVDAVLAVIAADGATVTPADRAVDHPAVLGFVTAPAIGTVSILDPAVVHQRLATLRAR
jgi:chemotaxis signal transduction protein